MVAGESLRAGEVGEHRRRRVLEAADAAVALHGCRMGGSDLGRGVMRTTAHFALPLAISRAHSAKHWGSCQRDEDGMKSEASRYLATRLAVPVLASSASRSVTAAEIRGRERRITADSAGYGVARNVAPIALRLLFGWH